MAERIPLGAKLALFRDWKTFLGGFVAGLLITALLIANESHARDLHGRLGLGYNSQFSNSSTTDRIPAISFKYAFTRDIAASLLAGLRTSTPSNSVFGVKLYKNLFYETNLNFYFALGAGLITANSSSGAEFLTVFGSEFFIPGLESIGFSVEMGAAFNNLSGSFVLQTVGVNFLDAGIHFYF